MINEIHCCSEFEKDLKTLLKRYATLCEDLKTFINAGLKTYHVLHQNTAGILPIQGLRITAPTLFKVKKFACKSLKGRGVASGIRLIYAYYPSENKFVFIQLYHKQDQTIENRDRISAHFPKPINALSIAHYKSLQDVLNEHQKEGDSKLKD
jgi:hypothetical protein